MKTLEQFNQELIEIVNQEAHLVAGVFFKESNKANRHGEITLIHKNEDPNPFYFDHTIQNGINALLACQEDVIKLAHTYNYNIEPILIQLRDGVMMAKSKYPH
jgi:hypothetical protein